MANRTIRLWVEDNPYKMALIMSVLGSLVYSVIYLLSMSTTEFDGLMVAIPFLFVGHYSVAFAFNLSERNKNGS
jgi:ABC-type antimicrobial peptide transport system permease subunit